MIKEGIFLEATQVDANVGKETEAGAPNITGRTAFYSYTSPSTVGAITTILERDNAFSLDGGTAKYLIAQFDASNSNPIYGRSTTIQPYSVKAFMWERVK